MEEGDTVVKGQALVELDREEASLQLRQARASLDEAKANFDRFQILIENNMVSQSEFETTRQRFESSKISVENAELDFAHTSIRAPISGVITRRMVELGDRFHLRSSTRWESSSTRDSDPSGIAYPRRGTRRRRWRIQTAYPRSTPRCLWSGRLYNTHRSGTDRC